MFQILCGTCGVPAVSLGPPVGAAAAHGVGKCYCTGRLRSEGDARLFCGRTVESIQIDSNRFKSIQIDSNLNIFNPFSISGRRVPSTHITCMRHTPLRAVGGVTPSTLTPVLIIGDHSSRTRRSLCSSRCCSHAARAHIQFARIHPFAMCMHASCAAQPAEPGAIDSNE